MPLLWLSLSILTGLLLGSFFPWSGWGWLGVSLIAAWIVLYRASSLRFLAFFRSLTLPDPRLKLPLWLLLAGLALGAWRYGSAQPVLSANQVAALNGQGVFRLSGVVSLPPDRRDNSTLLRMEVDQASLLDGKGHPGAARPVQGQILVFLPGKSDWQYGDRLEVLGQPEIPPEGGDNSNSADADFSYRTYLARQGVYSYIQYPQVKRLSSGAGNPILAAIYHLRDQAYTVIYRLFPAPEAPLLAGILLGIDSDLPPGLVNAFQVTGTAHIIAISGFNVAIVAALVSRLFKRFFSRWWAAGLAGLVILLYTLMVGATPSVVRAAIMGGLGLVAALFGRRFSGLSGLNTLTFTAAVMCLGDPFLPWDASFQLSFAATLGLVLYGDPLQDGFTRLLSSRIALPLAQKAAGPVGEYLLVTLAAQLLTLPVILYHFQRLSLSAVLVNPLVLPAQPLLMILSGLAVLVGMLWLPPARILAWLALPLSSYTIQVIQGFSSLPWGSILVEKLTPAGSILLLGLVIAPGLWPGIRQGVPQALKSWAAPSFVLVTLGLASAILFRVLASGPDGNLHLTLFDQDGAPVLLIKTPAGQFFLVNSSPSANRLSGDLGERLSPLDHHLDGLLIADCQTSPLGGLATLLERYPLKQAWWGCPAPEAKTAGDVLSSLSDQGTLSQRLNLGEKLSIEGGIQVEVLLSTPDSAAVLIQWKDFRALLPGRVSQGSLAPDSSTRPSLVFLDGRSFDSIQPEDYLALDPQVVIATSSNDPFLTLPVGWVQVSKWGWVSATTDGRKMWIEKGQ